MDSSHVSGGLLTREQAAEILGVRKNTLAVWSCQGRGPGFVKVGRCVRYSRESLERFIAENTIRTSAR